MIDTIIFDIGKVLVDFNWKTYLHKFGYEPEVEQQLANGIFLSKTWHEFDRSEKSDEELLFEFISHIPQYEKEVREVFEHCGNTVSKYEQSEAWLRELKKEGYKLYILSNYPKKTYEDTKEKQLSFLKYVDGGIFSFEVKKIKPEIEIYHALFEKYKIKPENAVFLDDNIDNIEAGEKLGLNTLLVTDPSKARDCLREMIRKV